MPDPASPLHQPALPENTTPDQLAGIVEAVLMSVDRPLTAAAIAAGLFAPLSPARDADTSDTTDTTDAPSVSPVPSVPSVSSAPSAQPTPPASKSAEALVKKAIDHLNSIYTQSARSFRIEPVAGGYRVMTLPQHAAAVGAFHRSRQNAKLSRPAVETLAIIAYKQPITRATLEAIRGVACGEVLRTLVDRRLVTIRGRAEELGRPLLYGTSKQFLDAFGLSSLNDLPSVAELKFGPPAQPPKPAGPAADPAAPVPVGEPTQTA